MTSEPKEVLTCLTCGITDADVKRLWTCDCHKDQVAHPNARYCVEALRTQLAAAEQARDIATQREDHFHALNTELTKRAESAERERDALRRIIDATAEAAGFAKAYDPSTLPSAVGHLRHRAERLRQQLDAVRSLCAVEQDYTAIKALELLDDASAGEG